MRYVFIGIETPVAEALKGSSTFQNLRGDLVANVNKIRKGGLWVLAGLSSASTPMTKPGIP